MSLWSPGKFQAVLTLGCSCVALPLEFPPKPRQSSLAFELALRGPFLPQAACGRSGRLNHLDWETLVFPAESWEGAGRSQSLGPTAVPWPPDGAPPKGRACPLVVVLPAHIVSRHGQNSNGICSLLDLFFCEKVSPY